LYNLGGKSCTCHFELGYTKTLLSQGIEELIRQAFAHVDVIGIHVADGHYDLIGPNGEIILTSGMGDNDRTRLEYNDAYVANARERPPPRPPWESPGSRHGGQSRHHLPPPGPRSASPQGPIPPPPTNWPPRPPPPGAMPGPGPPFMLSPSVSSRKSEQTKSVLGWMAGKLASAKKKVHLNNDDSDSDSSGTSLVDD
jgi:hypothetical protein